MTMERYERTDSIEPAGVMATACKQMWIKVTRDAPAVIAGRDQLATHESQAGPYGVAERSYYRCSRVTPVEERSLS